MLEYKIYTPFRKVGIEVQKQLTGKIQGPAIRLGRKLDTQTLSNPWEGSWDCINQPRDRPPPGLLNWADLAP